MLGQQGPSAGTPPANWVSEIPAGPIMQNIGAKVGWISQGPNGITDAPQAAVTIDRRNDDPIRFQSVDDKGLDYGPRPGGILRRLGFSRSNPQTTTKGQVYSSQTLQAVSTPLHIQWTPKLTGRAGPRQWAAKQSGDVYWLPPVWPSQGVRTTMKSISLNSYAGQSYGDKYMVPAVYVGAVQGR